jgi:tetrahydromethanopterin S-methyltransferase subunit C
MGRGILKWLAALGTGAATAVLAYLSGATAPEGVDPIVGGIAVALLTKLVTWLTSKVPTAPTA